MIFQRNTIMKASLLSSATLLITWKALQTCKSVHVKQTAHPCRSWAYHHFAKEDSGELRKRTRFPTSPLITNLSCQPAFRPITAPAKANELVFPEQRGPPIIKDYSYMLAYIRLLWLLRVRERAVCFCYSFKLHFSTYTHLPLTHPFFLGGEGEGWTWMGEDRFPENPEPCHKALQARRSFHPFSYKFCSENFQKNMILKSLVKIIPQLQDTKHMLMRVSLIHM